MNDAYKYVVFEGNIGAGKTTLSSLVARQNNAKLVLEEFEDNSFLPAFYKDPVNNAFPLELSFLADRYHQMKAVDFNDFVVSDYHITKSLAFAKTNLRDDEFDLFMHLFQIMHEKIRFPDVMIYLKWEISSLRKNIAKRGRDYEREISLEYLQTVEEKYFEIMSEDIQFPVLVVDCEGIDFVQDAADYRRITELLINRYENGVHYVSF